MVSRPAPCPMSAKADAEAAAALRELGATLKASMNAPKLHTRNEMYFAGSTNMSLGPFRQLVPSYKLRHWSRTRWRLWWK